MAQSKESKFFLSGTVSPVSVFRLNLHPKRCMPRMLEQEKREMEETYYCVKYGCREDCSDFSDTPPPSVLCASGISQEEGLCSTTDAITD